MISPDACRHYDASEVQANVAAALSNLSVLDECALDIAMGDGLEILVDAFARHKESAHVATQVPLLSAFSAH